MVAILVNCDVLHVSSMELTLRACPPSSQMLTWDVGKINPQKLPSLKGSMSLQAGASKPDENPSINIQFKIQQMAISGTRTRTHTHAHTITF